MPYEPQEYALLDAIAKANPAMTPENALALFLPRVRNARIYKVPYTHAIDASGPRGASRGVRIEVLYGKEMIETRALIIETPVLPVAYEDLPGYTPTFRKWSEWLAARLNRDIRGSGENLVYYKEDGVEMHPVRLAAGIDLRMRIYLLIPTTKWRK